MGYVKIKCKSALNKTKGRFPYNWDLNIYRGCLHSCQYCYAIYSHKYLDSDNFFNTVFIKENIVEELEKKLSSKFWKKEVINLGSVCDSYQPIEEKMKLMPEILKLMIKYENPIIISTKSLLILRDIDLINELSKITYVSIALTITNPSDKLNRLIEPNTPDYMSRFKVLKTLKKETNAQVGLHMMPLIPYLTTDRRSIEMMFKLAKKVDVDYVLIGLLNLRGQTKNHFLNFLKNNLSEYYDLINEYYLSKEIRSNFNKEYYKNLNELIKQYNINTKYSTYIENKQLSLF